MVDMNIDKFKKDLSKIIEDNKKKGFFAFEINTTHACNMACSYCFESETSQEPYIIDSDLIIKRIDELLKDEWFNSKYKGLKLDFWGGEPTLNLGLMKTLIDRYVENPKVMFHVYSNGYQMDDFYNLLKAYKKYYRKFDIQFSYDGQPIHDIHRKTKRGNSTAATVLKNTERFYELGFPIFFKSTITPDDFKYLSQVWDEFKIFYDKYNGRGLKTFNYHPTIDYHNKYNGHIEDFEKSILEIAKKEIDFYKENGEFLMAWFKGGKPLCSAGKNMIIVDTDNDVFFCHGVLYNEFKDQLKITNIKNDTFVRDIQINHEKIDSWKIEEHKECKNCSATLCMRCNAKKYELSSKTEMGSKWHDNPIQKNLCRYFKMFGTIHRAMRKIILEEN
jgi:uncharacterized protein